MKVKTIKSHQGSITSPNSPKFPQQRNTAATAMAGGQTLFDELILEILAYVCIGVNVLTALPLLAAEIYLACLIWKRMVPALRNAADVLRFTQESVRCAAAPIDATAVLCKLFGVPPARLLAAYEALDADGRAEVVDQIFGDLSVARQFKRQSRFVQYGYAWEQRHVHAVDQWDTSEASERVRRRAALDHPSAVADAQPA